MRLPQPTEKTEMEPDSQMQYRQESTAVHSRIRRLALTGAGSVALGLGVLGIVVPLLPTTCFLLLSAACFAKSSPRRYAWLMNNRMFGKYLHDYRSHKMIPLHLKLTSMAVLWATIAATCLLAVEGIWIRLGLLALASGITVHLVRLPSRPANLSRDSGS